MISKFLSHLHLRLFIRQENQAQRLMNLAVDSRDVYSFPVFLSQIAATGVEANLLDGQPIHVVLGSAGGVRSYSKTYNIEAMMIS